MQKLKVTLITNFKELKYLSFVGDEVATPVVNCHLHFAFFNGLFFDPAEKSFMFGIDVS
jgi:hypothetical protein